MEKTLTNSPQPDSIPARTSPPKLNDIRIWKKFRFPNRFFPTKSPPRKTPPEGPVRAKINSKKFPYGRLIARKPDDRTYINLPLP